MDMTDTSGLLAGVAILVGALGLVFLLAAFVGLRRGRMLRLASRLSLSIALLAISALLATIGIGTQGYLALTHEDIAATVGIQPIAPQKFRASIHLPDGTNVSQVLDGDEFYIDAHILKWKPIANILGLHTAYALDRFGGRYISIEDEQTAPRTVYSLMADNPIDLFNLRRRYELLSPLLDAQYGSATFAAANQPAVLEVRVSTTGLLIRQLPPKSD